MRGQIPVREEPTENEKKAMAVRQAAEAAQQRIALQHAMSERHEDMSKYRAEKNDLNAVLRLMFLASSSGTDSC